MAEKFIKTVVESSDGVIMKSCHPTMIRKLINENKGEKIADDPLTIRLFQTASEIEAQYLGQLNKGSN